MVKQYHGTSIRWNSLRETSHNMILRCKNTELFIISTHIYLYSIDIGNLVISGC